MKIQRLRRGMKALNVLLVLIVLTISWRTVAARSVPRGADEILRGPPVGPPPAPREAPIPEFEIHRLAELPISGDLPAAPSDPVGGPSIEGLSTTHELVSTWRSMDDNLDSCVNLLRLRDGAQLVVFVGVRVGDHQLVRVEDDRAFFRIPGTGEQTELVVSRQAVVSLFRGEAEPQFPPRPETTERPLREPIPIGNDGRRWMVPSETMMWLDGRGEKILDDVVMQSTKDRGLLVKEIRKGSVLRDIGILPGDGILSINGISVNSREDALRYLRGPGRGLARYDIVIERKGRLMTLTYHVRR